MTQTQIYSTNAQEKSKRTKKERRNRASVLLKRWAYNRRRGLPNQKLPSQSPEQERVRGIDCCVNVYLDTPEDERTNEGMLWMRQLNYDNYFIATEHYYYGRELSVIAKGMDTVVDIYKAHNEIKDYIASYVLY